ncbi:lycopene beta-cyclase CrtY [uncultured Erythrobacter sp.]|uniref:lycopene beta-cyclase CrtY n=1 Tax=uncultured Erythrobacter sp. TaxID=263913 RepID=UPI00262435E1|nr:lycopene beta-cyclase CrtY [uncultured Erythrobacter sp.]
MSDSQVDCVIVGGGLAGGLIALALQRARPEFRIRLIEAGRSIGGNHRWSWFDSDLSDQGRALLSDFRQIDWEDGYEVRFPKYRRELKTAYRSMASPDFHEGIMRALPHGSVILNRKAESLDARGVDLAPSQYDPAERISARSVIDCRSFKPSPHLKGGWQVFLGRHVRLEKPHEIDHPVIMDATVDQLAPHGNGGSYRFVYVLPLGAHDVFIEDTYYADDPLLDRNALSGRIDQYAHAHGWSDGTPVGHEAGVLPVLTGGNFARYQEEIRIPGVAIAGARGGFTHPLTSYTMCVAVENAVAIAEQPDLSGEQLAAFFDTRARQHWAKTGYYRLLARFLFFAAEPEKRVKVFQRFYKLREGLIERFYAARSSMFDKVRVLWGEPPIPIHKAIVAIFKSGPALKSKASNTAQAELENELQTEIVMQKETGA